MRLSSSTSARPPGATLDSRYRVATLDASSETEPLRLDPEDDGMALTVCYRGAPAGFAMRRIPVQDRVLIDPRSFIDGAAADRMVAHALRAELPPPVPRESRRLALGVAICTRDRADSLERCLIALEAMDRRALGELALFEVIVIDNASRDGRTREVVLRHPGVRYVLEPKPGLNFARNRALHETRGELLAYLDDDVVVDHGWLGGLLAAWSEDPDAGFLAGQVLPMELATPAQILFERRGGFRRAFHRERFRAGRPGDWFYPCTASFAGTGANMAVNRVAALAIGGFDPALDTGAPLPGGGDLDIFYRLVRAGHRGLYDPEYLVRHQHRRDLAGLRRQLRDSWGKSFTAFAVKSWSADPPLRGKWTLLLMRWFVKRCEQLALSALGRSPLPPALALCELWGGLVGLCGSYGRSRRRVARIAEARE